MSEKTRLNNAELRAIFDPHCSEYCELDSQYRQLTLMEQIEITPLLELVFNYKDYWTNNNRPDIASATELALIEYVECFCNSGKS